MSESTCPHCRGGDSYQVTESGMRVDPLFEDGGMRVVFRHLPWELAFMEHLRIRHNARYRELVAEMAEKHGGRTTAAQQRSRDTARTTDLLIERYRRQTEAGL